MSKQPDTRETTQSPAQSSTSPDATRHIGPTLEAEGNFSDVTGRALNIESRRPGSTEGTPDDVEVRTMGSDRSDNSAPEDVSTGSRATSSAPPLRTRLPGDTSSDPHTDVDPDNASAVQSRPERGAA